MSAVRAQEISPRHDEEAVITPDGGRLIHYLRSLPAFRELLFFLVWKDLKVQVAHTVLGFGWLLLRPVLNAVVLTFVFGRVAHLPSEGHPYLLFVLSGFLPWSYFSGVVGKAANALTGNAALVTKVYFPRIFLPISAVVAGLSELAVTFVFFVLIAGLMFGLAPGLGMLWVLLPLLLLLLTTTAASIWLAALSVHYRDVRQAVIYVLQLLMFLAPVIWPLSLLTERLGSHLDAGLLQFLAGLYPLFGIVEGFRRALLGGPMPWELLAVGFAMATFLLVTGVMYFQRCEKQLADGV